MTAHEWRLYVDESGRFEDLTRDVSVAGILLSCSIPEAEEESLRAALEDATPGYPWPMHYHLFHRPSMVALGWERAGGGSNAGLRELPWVLRFLELRAPETLERARRALASGREPLRADLETLDNLLAAEQPAWSRRLADVARTLRFRIQHLVNAVLDSANARTASPPAAMVVVGGEAERGDAARDGDRYLTLLRVVIERTVHVLGQYPGRHEVHLHVLGRDVAEPALNAEVPLHVRHLGAIRSELMPTTPDNVRLVLQPVATFHGDDVAVGHALADLAAGHAVRALKTGSLAHAEARLGHLGAAVRSGAPTRTHLASSGAPHARLVALREGRTPPAMPATTRGWAVQQAADWEAP